jgi:hypothetical protein
LLLTGDPPEEIVRLAETRRAKLVVMGLHYTGRLGPRMGSVTYACSVSRGRWSWRCLRRSLWTLVRASVKSEPMNHVERRFKQGEHICAVYDRADKQLSVAASYIAEGLRCDERCLYVAQSPEELDSFRDALGRAGLSADTAETEGALLMMVSGDAHLAGGAFDCERMLRMLNDTLESALNSGFTGLRTCGDMSWLLGDPPGCAQVVEYEALLNVFFRDVRALGMCQYDARRLPPHLLDHALATHPSATIDGRFVTNPFYQPEPVGAAGATDARIDWKLADLRRRASR